ncbi:aminoacyl tRNA synthase complex-interacting multifunctional protein 2 isoform X2 [Leptopilina heterotoma]|uniref:aminoacyl tRNA synthase complex-interacting multifunctional protein 2 isoform X2 n=1 Tax=Leptopilina heterotoma TaxID=63436 RepID=UPI001CAA3FB4|nr:aminoacyl tRNA synthase complex-interacting multifunctional protein 2 isoform X2 [Leptopilina heterotoma]
MSGPVAMYTLKPIMSDINLKIEKNVMYEMNNIHEIQHKIIANDDVVHHSSNEDTIVTEIKEQENCSELNILEARQEKILSQLAEIKQQVAIFRDVLKQSNSNSIVKTSTVHTVHNPVTVDIILSANPKNPPFSILALTKIWKDSIFQIQSHTHSSINESVPEFSLNDNKENKTQKNCINLRLIWKDVPDVRLNCGLTKCPIDGEVNFLRYLCRVVKSHSYENSNSSIEEITRIDSILDFCHSSMFETTRQVEKAILRLNEHLTKGPWLLNKSEPSVIDMAVWSLIKRLNLKLQSPSLAKWFQECEKKFV